MNIIENSSTATQSHHLMRKIIIGFTFIGIALISYLGYSNPELFQASITGTGINTTIDTHFYINNDYEGRPGDEGFLELRMGQELAGVKRMTVTLKGNPTGLVFTDIDKTGGVFVNEPNFKHSIADGKINLGDIESKGFTGLSSYTLKDNDLLVKIKFKLDPNLKGGEKIAIEQVSAIIEGPTQYPLVPSFTKGLITVLKPIDHEFTTLLNGGIKETGADGHLYISSGYKVKATDKGYFEVRAGKDIINQGLEKLKVTILYPKDKIKLLSASDKGGVLESEQDPTFAVKATSKPDEAAFEINFGQLSKGYTLKDDDLLFKVSVELDPQLANGTKIPLVIDSTATIFNLGATNGTQFINGQIEIQNNVVPNAPSNLDKLAAIVLTLSDDALSKLSPEDKKVAYRTAYVMIHSSSVVNSTLKVADGVSGLISIPAPTADAITKYKAGKTDEFGAIRAIIEDPNGDGDKADGLAALIGKKGVRVSTFSGAPGLMKLQAFGSGSLDMINATDGNIKIVPGLDYSIDLKISDQQLAMMGVNDDATLTNIRFNDIKWVPAKASQLDETALKSGILRKGPAGGSVSLHVEAENAAKTVIKSNTISVNVPSPADLAGILLTLSKGTIDRLESNEKKQAFKSVYVSVNQPDAAGKAITLEGVPKTIPSPTNTLNCNTEKRQCIDSITNQLKNTLASATVNVSDTGIPGVLKLTANGTNTSLLDKETDLGTTSGEVMIVPAMDYVLELPFNKTYQFELVGKNTEGERVSPFTFNDVKWQPQPVNLVDKNSLDGGLLKRGDQTGTSSIFVEKENSNKQVVKSNQIAVKVASEPIIEYFRRIGGGSIERGSKINLEAKVTDANAIADIKSIKASIVRTSATDYAGLLKDNSAVWFDANYLSELLKTANNGTQNQKGTTTKENFRIYQFSIEAPQKTELVDGNYQLVIEITDLNGKTAPALLPIRIGAVASGDLNGDGTVTMLDVITIFNIVNGTNQNPSADQIKAADLNGDGTVTMLDVLTLFNKVNQ